MLQFYGVFLNNKLKFKVPTDINLKQGTYAKVRATETHTPTLTLFQSEEIIFQQF